MKHKVTFNECIAYIFAVLFLLVIPTLAFNGCNKTKKRYVITTDDSKDTVDRFDYIDIVGLKCIHYHKKDGTDVAYHTYKLDTIQ